MNRTDKLMSKGLSADDALKVVIYADQGLRWLKNSSGLEHQKKVDSFVDLIKSKPRQKVKEFSKFIREKYYAKEGEEVSKEDFERRWHEAESIILTDKKMTKISQAS